MATVFFLTHPDVLIDPDMPVPDWTLSPRGLARMRTMLTRPWTAEIAHVASSTERKAMDGAAILAAHLGLTVQARRDLGENDRSATGYLPRAAFEILADAFFARPHESVAGWERAVDAQSRIVRAIAAVLALAPTGNVAIVSHGAVGGLLLCHLRGTPISREADQPPGFGGNLLAFDRDDWTLLHDWQQADGPSGRSLVGSARHRRCGVERTAD